MDPNEPVVMALAYLIAGAWFLFVASNWLKRILRVVRAVHPLPPAQPPDME